MRDMWYYIGDKHAHGKIHEIKAAHKEMEDSEYIFFMIYETKHLRSAI